MEAKSVDGKFMEESKKFVKEFSWEIGSIDSISMDIASSGTKIVETNWINLKSIELNFIDGMFVKLCSVEVGSMETAFINGETRIKTTSLTGMPGEPTSYKCIEMQLVSREENSSNLIYLMKNLWKLTSFIKKPDESF